MAERQTHAEARRIIAGLVERILAIEASQEPTGAPETASEGPDRGSPRSGTGPQEAAQPWSGTHWWHRMFGS